MLYRASQRKGSSIIYASTERGGHCAWHEGLYPAGASFAERLVVQFFAALLAQQSHTHYILTVVRRMYRRQLSPRRPLRKVSSETDEHTDSAGSADASSLRSLRRAMSHGEEQPYVPAYASQSDDAPGVNGGRVSASRAGSAAGSTTQQQQQQPSPSVWSGGGYSSKGGSKKLRRLPSEGAGTSVDLALADAHARRMRSRAQLRRDESSDRAAAAAAAAAVDRQGRASAVASHDQTMPSSSDRESSGRMD